MSLTQLQARDRYIVGSIIQFLDRNLKSAYDTEVALTSSSTDPAQKFPTPITIRKGKPDDLSVVTKAPVIAVSTMGSGESDRAYAIGTANIWRHRAYLLSCFPSLDANGAPCDTAHELLRSYVQDVFETECIRILDYSNPSFGPTNKLFTGEVAYIVKVSDPIDRGMTTALAYEKHRFDVHITVKFCVSASLAT